MVLNIIWHKADSIWFVQIGFPLLSNKVLPNSTHVLFGVQKSDLKMTDILKW